MNEKLTSFERAADAFRSFVAMTDLSFDPKPPMLVCRREDCWALLKTERYVVKQNSNQFFAVYAKGV